MIGSPSGADVRALLSSGRPEAWLELVLRYGKTFRCGAVLATCEPDVVHALLMDRVHTVKRSSLHAAMRRLPGADGLLFLDGEAWVKRLRALTPVFHATNLDRLAGHIHATAAVHARTWRERGTVDDLYTCVVRLGAAIVLRIGYGLDPASAVGQRLASALLAYKAETLSEDPRRRLDEFGAGPEKVLDLPWILRTIFGMGRRMRGVAAAVREALASRTDGEEDWLARLRATDLSQAEIAVEANHLYGAYNAIDYVTTCGLLELASRPDQVARLRAEWARELGDAPPSAASLPRLRDTANVMREVLRCYPVTHAVARRTGAPLEIGGVLQPAGTEVVILLYALHHHPEHWDDALVFDPDRFAADPPAPRVPFAYVPFLDGPRKCIGRHMAELQFTLVLHAVLRDHDLVPGRTDVPVTPFVVPRFRGPLPVTLQPRQA